MHLLMLTCPHFSHISDCPLPPPGGTSNVPSSPEDIEIDVVDNEDSGHDIIITWEPPEDGNLQHH